ncbi:MAG: TetR/AcrR family transcriptional regulator [Spirochaetes bacterium]|nr:TetR/AcrR family transcriptional regulator [Spirochaetota bacterium]
MEDTTEKKIKNAALREFAQHGLEGARVDRIAQKAKINKAMIYYHFKSKEDLYESILIEFYSKIFPRVAGNISKDKGVEEQLESIVTFFIDFIKEMDQDYIRVMLRELSSGGKYFKKLMLPNVIIPMMGLVQELFTAGIKQGTFKNIVPHLTFIQMLGSIVFTNAIRITLSDTDFGKMIFNDDFFEEYKKNMLTVVKTGIMAS